MFNILYEENINCRLSTSTLVDDKMLNWNRINAQICFNYLQQEFYLVKPTMRTLAQGKSNKAILKLLRILINTSQSNFGDLNLDDECIRDIADIITAEADPHAEGAAAMDSGNIDNDMARPRGAVLTSDGQDFMTDHLPKGKSSAQFAAEMEERKQ